MLWLVPGYIAGKAAMREMNDAGFSIFCLFIGLIGYFCCWMEWSKTMRELHGMKPRVPGTPGLVKKFFGEG
jgi:hypothetical protein